MDGVRMGRCLGEDLSVCLPSGLCLAYFSCSVLGIYSPAPRIRGRGCCVIISSPVDETGSQEDGLGPGLVSARPEQPMPEQGGRKRQNQSELCIQPPPKSAGVPRPWKSIQGRPLPLPVPAAEGWARSDLSQTQT